MVGGTDAPLQVETRCSLLLLTRERQTQAQALGPGSLNNKTSLGLVQYRTSSGCWLCFTFCFQHNAIRRHIGLQSVTHNHPIKHKLQVRQSCINIEPPTPRSTTCATADANLIFCSPSLIAQTFQALDHRRITCATSYGSSNFHVGIRENRALVVGSLPLRLCAGHNPYNLSVLFHLCHPLYIILLRRPPHHASYQWNKNGLVRCSLAWPDRHPQDSVNLTNS